MTETDLDITIIDGMDFVGWAIGGLEVEATMLGQVQNQVFIFDSDSRSCNAWPDSQKRAHYGMYLLYQKKLMHILTINNILAEKKMVVGSGYSDVFGRDFYSAIHAAYYGPKIQSMELLPDVV
ncbi:hypothetical protein HKD37_03G006284 [Glycine soja]|nr:hypothetical protein GmHk_03G006340 [Glycine max]